MSEQPCHRNHCPNEAEARITLIGGNVTGTMTYDLCLTHYYEAVQAITGMPAMVGVIPREAHEQPRGEQ
jgi:hypothetical protein